MRARLFVTIAITLAMAVCLAGCGQKVSEKISEKVVENVIEHAASQDGQKVDVDIDSKSGAVSIVSEGSGDGEGGGSMTIQTKPGEEGAVVTATGTDASGGSFKVEGDGSSVTITKEGGEQTVMTGENAQMPENFPEDAPTYPGLTLNLASADTAESVFSIQGTTADAMAGVADALKKGAVDKGWKETMNMSQGDEMTMLAYEKEGRTLNIMVIKDGEATTVQITVAKQ